MADTVVTIEGSAGSEAENKLINKCLGQDPSAKDRAAFVELLRSDHSLVEALGKVDEFVRIRILAGYDPSWGHKQAVTMQLERMATELGLEGSSPLENMLIGHALNCWIRLHLVEEGAQNTWGNQHSLSSGTYWDHRLSNAQARFLRSVESLARVRRLLKPAVQVNIAEKQVNVVGVGALEVTRREEKAGR
jgi:hypothetical protein